MLHPYHLILYKQAAIYEYDKNGNKNCTLHFTHFIVVKINNKIWIIKLKNTQNCIVHIN